MLSRLAAPVLTMALTGCLSGGEVLPIECDSFVNDGGSVPTDAGTPEDAAPDSVTPSIEPFDACDADQEGDITNYLGGTCFWEQCRDGEKSLFLKPPGVPCVFRPTTGNSEYAIGACDHDGTCTDGFIGAP